MKNLTFAILFLLFSSATFCQADTFYVSNSGNDGRSSGQAQNRNQPWRTIQRAVNEAGAGDTITVLDGVYNEQVFLSRSGSAGREIVLQSENREGAKIRGSIFGSDVSYIRIQGFDLANWFTTSSQSKGINFVRCHHIVVRNNRVHDCRGGGISFDQSDWLLIEWNIVHHNAFYDPGQHSGISVFQPQYRGEGSGAVGITIRNNTCYANQNLLNNPLFGRPTDGNGIVVDDTKNESPGGNGQLYDRITVVENNLCFLNGGQGVHCYLSNNVIIRNNTCFKNMSSFDFGGEVSVVASERVYVYNNILFARSGKNANLQFESSSVWWDYNIVYNGPSFQLTNGPSTTYSHPLFKSGTLVPAGFSPAVNSGLTESFRFPLDVNGGIRIVDGAIDRGANEFDPANN